MLTGKDYCDYETCVALYNMGLVPHPYDNTEIDKALAIISLYEAQKWLREEKKIHIEIDLLMSKWYPTIVSYDRLKLVELRGYESYEEALLEGIKEAVKILKEE